MNRSRRILATVTIAAVAVTACGGDDDAAPVATPAPTPTADQSAEETADETADGAPDATGSTSGDAASGDVVDPTIAPDLPEAFLDGVGPLAVIGDPLPEFPRSGDDPAIGLPAPVIVGETFDGERVTVDPAADGPTWIVFLAHWCPHCNDEVPVINDLAASGGIPDGIDVVAVSTGVDPSRPNYPPGEWLDDEEWAFPAIADGVDTVAGEFIAATAYGLTSFPYSVLVDGDGIVRARWSGNREPSELTSLLTNNLPLG